MTEAHVFDLLPGYALEILDEADLLRVARHLPHCPACRAELATYLVTVDQLAQAGPLQTPAPELRGKAQRRVAAFSQAAAAAVPVAAAMPPISAPPERSGQRGWLRGLLAPRFLAPRLSLALNLIGLVLIVCLAASALTLWQRVNQLQASLPASNMHLIALSGTSAAPHAQGYLMAFSGDIYGTLTVENVPALESGKQYQLWLLRDGQRANGGVFSVNPDGYGALMVAADRPLDTFQSFGITIEPSGGSPGPTGQKVLGSQR